MNLNKKPLLLAITVGMGLVPLAGAFAVPLNNLSDGTTPNPISIPFEGKESASEYYSMYDDGGAADGLVSAGGDMDAYIYTMPGYIVKKTEQKNLIVKVALTGGAKFTKAPVLICAHSGIATQNDLTDLGVSAATWSSFILASDYAANGFAAQDMDGSTTAVVITPTVNSVNVPSYSFSFPDGFNVVKASSGACLLSFSGAEPYPVGANATALSVIKGSPGVEVSMTVEVSYNDFFGVKTTNATIPVVRFSTAYKAAFQATNPLAGTTAAAPVIDVGVLSKRFKENNVNVNEVFAGHVVITAAVANMRGANGIPVSAADLISSATLTFSGPTITSISKVTLHLPDAVDADGCKAAALLTGQVIVGTGGTASDVITIPINDTNDAYSAFISSVSDPDSASGFAVCLVADGLKTMAPGYVGLTVNVTSPDGKVTELANIPNFVEVTRNGTVVRVLNVPGKSSDPYQVNVRMFNVSNSELSSIKGTLYGVDGKEIATDIMLADKLAPNNMKLLKSADLVRLAGKEWEGRAWLLIQAPVSSDSFRVQVLMKNPTGELANLSTDAAD